MASVSDVYNVYERVYVDKIIKSVLDTVDKGLVLVSRITEAPRAICTGTWSFVSRFIGTRNAIWKLTMANAELKNKISILTKNQASQKEPAWGDAVLYENAELKAKMKAALEKADKEVEEEKKNCDPSQLVRDAELKRLIKVNDDADKLVEEIASPF